MKFETRDGLFAHIQMQGHYYVDIVTDADRLDEAEETKQSEPSKKLTDEEQYERLMVEFYGEETAPSEEEIRAARKAEVESQLRCLNDALRRPKERCVPTADLITSAIHDSYALLSANERLVDFLQEHQHSEAARLLAEVEAYQQQLASWEPATPSESSESEDSFEMPQECWDF